MSALPGVVLAAALIALAPGSTLQRDSRDDTIYVVTGSPEQLADVQARIGSRWKGGVIVDKDEERGLYRYWAFGERSAPEAREFIFGAMSAGLKLDIQPYEERKSFSTERASLDAIATSCGLRRDPFFVTPVASVRISFAAEERPEAVKCATDKLQALPLPVEIRQGKDTAVQASPPVPPSILSVSEIDPADFPSITIKGEAKWLDSLNVRGSPSDVTELKKRLETEGWTVDAVGPDGSWLSVSAERKTLEAMAVLSFRIQSGDFGALKVRPNLFSHTEK